MEPLHDKGHTLWMGNFCNAPALAIKLKFMKTDCFGTLYPNRKNVPKIVKEKN
jgi:hypothetical protein